MNQTEAHYGILRVGVIGCGKMSRNHAKAVAGMDCAKIVAIADPAIAKDEIPEWFDSDVSFFESSDEMMSTAELDVVHIISPPATHYSIAMFALNEGLHVFVEKPFVSTQEEAEEILSIAEVKGLKVCAGHQLLFTRAARLLRDSLDSVDKVVHIESFFSFNTVRRGISPVDQLVDILPHPVYLLEDFMNRSRPDGEAGIEIDAIRADHNGEVRALLSAGDVTGSLVVSLMGRPVDSYIRVIGTNGSIHADFVRGYLVKSLGPGASVFSVLLAPFGQGWQRFWRTAGAIFRLFSERKKGYPGLPDLLSEFYDSTRGNCAEPVSRSSLQNTVAICESVEAAARKSEQDFETSARSALEKGTDELTPLDPTKGTVLITGGTGLFGRPTASRLRNNGWPVTVLSRSIPPASRQIQGVNYVAADLGERIPAELLKDVETVIHAAAETAGGRSAQEKNSIKATRSLLEQAEDSGVANFVHISSIAVLKPSGGSVDSVLNESSPVDLDNLSRGPYVWGKAESENIAAVFGRDSRIKVKIVRLGPLVDYDDFKPPGRLGREIHNLYVAMGGSKDRLSVCSVQTGSKVMQTYVSDFEDMPAILNLVEPDPPSRKDLLARWKERRQPLRVLRLPFWVLSILSPILVFLQKVLLRSENPINIKSAFSSERYDTAQAAATLQKGVDA